MTAVKRHLEVLPALHVASLASGAIAARPLLLPSLRLPDGDMQAEIKLRQPGR